MNWLVVAWLVTSQFAPDERIEAALKAGRWAEAEQLATRSFEADESPLWSPDVGAVAHALAEQAHCQPPKGTRPKDLVVGALLVAAAGDFAGARTMVDRAVVLADADGGSIAHELAPLLSLRALLEDASGASAAAKQTRAQILSRTLRARRLYADPVDDAISETEAARNSTALEARRRWAQAIADLSHVFGPRHALVAWALDREAEVDPAHAAALRARASAVRASAYCRPR